MKQRISCVVLVLVSSVGNIVLAKNNTEEAGDNLHYILVFATWAGAQYYENEYAVSGQFVKSFVSSQVITEILKRTTDKERPNGNCCRSFPSGHASKAFMAAAFLHRRYDWRIALPSYIGAAYVAYSRVYADKHYSEDVVAGALIGILSSFNFTIPYKSVNLHPLIEVKQSSLTLEFTW